MSYIHLSKKIYQNSLANFVKLSCQNKETKSKTYIIIIIVIYRVRQNKVAP